MSVVGNVVGCAITSPDTFIIQDENGKEYTAVMVEEEVDLNATANDIRKGLLAANNDGLVTGEKIIPAYHTFEGYKLVPKGSEVTLPNLDPSISSYDYTKLQAIICLYNTSLNNSVAADKVVILDNVYNVKSTDSISPITKNHENKSIELGIANDSDTVWIIRYFMYKEVN